MDCRRAEGLWEGFGECLPLPVRQPTPSVSSLCVIPTSSGEWLAMFLVKKKIMRTYVHAFNPFLRSPLHSEQEFVKMG